MFPRIWIPLFLLLAALAPNARAAANGAPVWTNLFDEPPISRSQANAIAVDQNGNAIVTGYSTNSGSGNDYVTIKYSGAGVPLWTNRFNGPGNSDDVPSAIAVDGIGNVFVTGYSRNGTNNDYATVAYSSEGAPLWTNYYNGPRNRDDLAYAVAVDGSGDVFVTGQSGGTASTAYNNDYATIKYSGAGVPLWTNLYDGNNNDIAHAIAVDANGNAFVTGFGSSECATVAYSGVGVPLWTNRFSGLGNGSDGGRAITVDRGGNVFVTGYSYATNGHTDYVTVAYSEAGVPLWTNYFNGPEDNDDNSATAVAVDKNGNVFVTGFSGIVFGTLDYVTVAYSSAGVPLWTNRYNGPGNSIDWLPAMAVDGYGNVFVTGTSVGSGSGPDFATVAYSSAGVPLWTNRYNELTSNGDSATAMAIDQIGNVFVTGSSASSETNVKIIVTIKYAAMLTLTQAAADEGQYRFQFNADANLTYAVEFRDAASTTNWVTLTNLPAQPAATNLTFTNAITSPARLYRVRTP
ncbi:MAG: SBBP repeat-containing protein [Verrucomicrobia bacterium]|nr:SBBP repeat-containing protein [Verrucomicrobiota bacterium]